MPSKPYDDLYMCSCTVRPEKVLWSISMHSVVWAHVAQLKTHARSRWTAWQDWLRLWSSRRSNPPSSPVRMEALAKYMKLIHQKTRFNRSNLYLMYVFDRAQIWNTAENMWTPVVFNVTCEGRRLPDDGRARPSGEFEALILTDSNVRLIGRNVCERKGNDSSRRVLKWAYKDNKTEISEQIWGSSKI
jgi:hypothetical protein